MGLSGPELKQRSALEHEFFGVRRLRESVAQAFEYEPKRRNAEKSMN